MVHVIALVTRVSGIGWVCLAVNAVGCLGAAQIIKSVCVAGANLCWLVLVVRVWCGCIVGGVLVSD